MRSMTTAAMTPAAMKAYVKHHFQEFVNAKNVNIVYETIADDFLDHDGPGGRPIDRDGDREMMRVMHERFPDLQVTIEDMIAEGDKVVCRNLWRRDRPEQRQEDSVQGDRDLAPGERQARRALGERRPAALAGSRAGLLEVRRLGEASARNQESRIAS